MIYAGSSAGNLRHTGYYTPHAFTRAPLSTYWSPEYYQAHLEGYEDSSLIFKNNYYGDRIVNFELKKNNHATSTQSAPNSTKETQILESTRVIPVKIFGYSPKAISKDINIDSKLAMFDAKQKAIERAGIKLESLSNVTNFELLSDTIETKSKGILLPGFEFVEFGYDESGVYKVLLIGSVQSTIQ